MAVHVFTVAVSVPLTALARRRCSATIGAGSSRDCCGWSMGRRSWPTTCSPRRPSSCCSSRRPGRSRSSPTSVGRPGRPPSSSAGFLVGLATLVKHQAASGSPPSAGRSCAPVRRPLPRGVARLALVAGFAVPSFATWAAFRRPAARATCVLAGVAQRPYAANPITAAGALERAASYLLPWLLATAPLWWAWRSSRPRLDPHARRLFDGLVVLGLLPAFAGFRFFPHYFVPTVFALALGAAPAVADGWERPRARRSASSSPRRSSSPSVSPR